jgi:ribosomal protein S18 acetylase RimI-like enzyme
VEYRFYKPDDFDALYAIEKICFEPPFRFDTHYMRRLVAAANTATWVAEDCGRMAGFAIVEWSGSGSGISAYILTIEVLPPERRRGVASELLRRVERSARTASASAIWLHVDQSNLSAIQLYEKQGYVSAGAEGHFYAADRPALLYRKDLKLNSASS